MKCKKKKALLWLCTLFSAIILVSIPAQAKTPREVTVDRYLGRGKNYTVIAYNNQQKNLKVYKSKSLKAKKYAGNFNYGAAAIVNVSKLKKGKKTAWIPIYMYNQKTKKGYKTGYLRARYVTLQVIGTKKFSNNKRIDKAIKTGFKYLGTPFKLPGDSLESGIDCAQFIAAVYRAGGKSGLGTHTNYLQAASKEIFYHRRHNKNLSKKQLKKLKAGDLLFYLRDDTTGPIDHVAMYIGNGLMINSSGHYGDTYPFGGITIKRVQYGRRYIVRAMRVRGI